MKHARGFTLIELMIVVVILGILLSIVIGAYQSYKAGGNSQVAVNGNQNTVIDLDAPTSVSVACQNGKLVQVTVKSTGTEISDVKDGQGNGTTCVATEVE